MKKLGRNDLCPCGSGKKYKKCHLGLYNKEGHPILPKDVEDMARRFYDLPKEPFARGGFLTGRSFIDTIHDGKRYRAVGEKIYERPEDETFHEFILFFLGETIGHTWIQLELKKPNSDQHILGKWFQEAIDATNRKLHQVRDSKVFTVKKTGNLRSLLSLAYDFYSLAHCNAHTLPNLLKRLKSGTSFQSARYEIAVGGMAVRAGFDIKWINDKSKHVEFIGVNKYTNDKVAFEAKSHFRTGVFDKQVYNFENDKIKIIDHIKEAIDQAPKDVALVVFDDLNLPLSLDPIEDKKWVKSINATLKKYNFFEFINSDSLSALFVTNFSWYFHENLENMGENETVSFWSGGGKYSLATETISLLDTALKQHGFVPSRLEEEFGIKEL